MEATTDQATPISGSGGAAREIFRSQGQKRWRKARETAAVTITDAAVVIHSKVPCYGKGDGRFGLARLKPNLSEGLIQLKIIDFFDTHGHDVTSEVRPSSK